MKASSIAALAVLITAVSAQATTYNYEAFLSGPAESPPNASPGTGYATVSYDDVLHLMKIDVVFSGLVGTTSAAHIHAPTAVAGTGTASVATQTPSFIGFPLGVTAGAFSSVFDMTLAASYRAGFITSSGGTVPLAEAALAAALQDGKAYFNIHTTAFPGGEIRGFLEPAVPDSSTTAPLMILGALGILVFARNQRRNAVI